MGPGPLAPVAQWITRPPSKRETVGSTPTRSFRPYSTVGSCISFVYLLLQVPFGLKTVGDVACQPHLKDN